MLKVFDITMKSFFVVVLLLVAVSAKPSSKRVQKPAFFRPSPRITNGEDASEGQFPHQVSYQWGLLGFDQHVCGGTILSETWILTAGHCITQVPEFGDHVVVAGVTNLLEDTAEKQAINVMQKIVHPDFGGNVGPNDIALLQLESPLTFGDLVKPISLPEADSTPSGDVVLSGWGSTSTIDIPILPLQLQYVNIPLLAFDECSAAVDALLEVGEENPLSVQSNICTGPLTGGVSACSGDSGGPLIQDDNIVGIVSWGFTPCGADGAPSVYTRVSNFIDFIEQYVTDLPK